MFETFNTYQQVADLAVEDLLDWLDHQVYEKTEWGNGGGEGPNPILEFHVMSDHEDSTYVLFGGDFEKCGSVERVLRTAIWNDIKQRIKRDRDAYALPGEQG